ncbi:hypothetical protein F2Q69_00022406 [Brassica cretica]|uniref:Uncharacterized protein n=1 Tax=Brassica cretica TaxID=69181 RepID=A0A8S9Q172_BRACR|nr:hypothetical protein F2Q69_00022406 [Brassica cretica]
MSSSSNVQMDGDVEMSDATVASPSVLPVAWAVPAHIAEFLSIQSEMSRCEAEKTVIPTCDVSPRPEFPVEAPTFEAPTFEALPVCDAVPAGEAVVKNMLASDAKVKVQTSGSSMTPVRVVEGEPAPESMPPPAKRSIVVGLSAPSAAPAVMPKSRKRPSANLDAAKKRKCVEAGPLPTRASGSGLASRHRAKVIEDAHFLEAARFESQIGELERDLGKTPSYLLEAKEAKTAKSSDLRRLKCKIKSGEESSVSAIGEAKEAMHAKFQIRLLRISGFLDSLAAVYVRDFALAGVEGGTNEVGEAPQSPRVEGAMLPVRRGELVGAEGDFDLILADLKSEYVLPSCSSEPVGQDFVAWDVGGSVALNAEGVVGEDEAPRAEDD